MDVDQDKVCHRCLARVPRAVYTAMADHCRDALIEPSWSYKDCGGNEGEGLPFVTCMFLSFSVSRLIFAFRGGSTFPGR